MHGMSVYLFGCGGERYANATVDAAGLIPFRLKRSLGNVVPTGICCIPLLSDQLVGLSLRLRGHR